MSKITVDALTKVSPAFRRLHWIRRRKRALEWQYDVQNRRDMLDLVDLSVYRRTIVELMELDRLVTNSIINNIPVAECGVDDKIRSMPRKIADHSMILFGHHVGRPKNALGRQAAELRKRVSRSPKCERRVLEKELARLEMTRRRLRDLRKYCLESRSKEMRHRLGNAISTAQRRGWFMVHNTLTVDPAHYGRVFSCGDRSWSEYIRSVDRAVALSKFSTWREAEKERRKGNRYHDYCAIVEPGTKSGRLHIHVVHMMAALPAGCCDPNAGVVNGIAREIVGFRRFWRKNGKSAARMVRYGVSDAFGKAGWDLPAVRLSDGRYECIKLQDPGAIAGYLAKYLSANEGRITKGGLRWRVRMSQRLGLEVYEKTVERLDRQELRTLIRMNSSSGLRLRGRRLPIRLLQRSALRERLKRLGWKKRRRALVYLASIDCMPSLCERLRTGQICARGRALSEMIRRTIGSFATIISSSTVVCRVQEVLDELSQSLFSRPALIFGGSLRKGGVL